MWLYLCLKVFLKTNLFFPLIRIANFVPITTVSIGFLRIKLWAIFWRRLFFHIACSSVQTSIGQPWNISKFDYNCEHRLLAYKLWTFHLWKPFFHIGLRLMSAGKSVTAIPLGNHAYSMSESSPQLNPQSSCGITPRCGVQLCQLYHMCRMDCVCSYIVFIYSRQ